MCNLQLEEVGASAIGTGPLAIGLHLCKCLAIGLFRGQADTMHVVGGF